jgi:arylsulfatase A-like enzyme
VTQAWIATERREETPMHKADRRGSQRPSRSLALKAFLALIAILTTLSGVALAQGAEPEPPARPNVVILLVDDAAFMDFGAYGGEARTPNIDALAARGVMFTRYRTSPLCSPSRAMLLTGVDNHRTGVATIPEVLPPEQRGKRGYALHFEPGVETVAVRLRNAGYRTYMTGKWHLGGDEGQLPDSHGFDRSYALEASGADNWEHKSYMPYYADAPWYEDGKPVRRPADVYSSTLLVDRMIGYLDAGRSADTPFLAYLAFQAVHIPVQAPRRFTDRYKGAFDGGWDALKDARWRRAQAMGLVPPGAAPPSAPATMRPWRSLTRAEQRLQARSMEVYAGMLEAMDHEIGRLIGYLDRTGALSNTVFFITSDNGPEPSAPGAQTGFPTWMRLHGYTRDIATLGEKGSYNWIGPEWATAVATPGHLFKFYATEGGTRVPLIVSGPGVATGLRSDANAFVTDITPTILAMTNAGPTDTKSVSIDGRSLLPILRGGARSVYDPGDDIGIEVSGNAALVRGNLKLLRTSPPYGDGAWRLFDVASDPGETRDLSTERPDDFAALKAGYAAYAARNGVLEMPEGYAAERQVGVNTIARQVSQYGALLAFAALATLAALTFAIAAALRMWRRSRK